MNKKKQPTFVCGPHGQHTDLATFNLAEWNLGTMWETRIPGQACEETWESGQHEHATLTAAVHAAFPDFAAYGLNISQAARLCLHLNLVLGTGVDVPEEYAAIKNMRCLKQPGRRVRPIPDHPTPARCEGVGNTHAHPDPQVGATCCDGPAAPEPGMRLRACCPNDSGHQRFVTTAHVMQEWEVNAEGEFLVAGVTLETTDGPDVGNLWSCATCGATATVTRR